MLAAMDITGLLMVALIYVVPIAIGFLALYLVVRAAVLSALRAHTLEQRSRDA